MGLFIKRNDSTEYLSGTSQINRKVIMKSTKINNEHGAKGQNQRFGDNNVKCKNKVWF